MGLKDIMGGFKNLIAESAPVKDMMKKGEPKRLTMKVVMLGARGVGKTSVITSMYNSQKQAVSGTNLFLAADAPTRMILDDKKIQLTGIFSGIHRQGDRMTESGISGDYAESSFRFTYGMNSERINIDLEIRDYPGEYLRDSPDIVADYIREANAVMIVLDTPCLMEAGGRYHEGKNRPELVKNFIRQYLSNEEEKLILFVPLKCEKYYQEGRIDEVTTKIRSEYADLIAYLRDKENEHGFKKKICCAITPIQTLGSVAFESFKTDEYGKTEELMTKDNKILPAGVNYRYLTSNAAYAPQYCEQPLYYLLSFVSKQYQQLRQQEKVTGWFGKLREALRLLPNMEEFLLEIASLATRRIDGNQGYQILFGKGRI